MKNHFAILDLLKIRIILNFAITGPQVFWVQMFQHAQGLIIKGGNNKKIIVKDEGDENACGLMKRWSKNACEMKNGVMNNQFIWLHRCGPFL